MTVYSRDGHTFAIIAGLRLDTTDMRDGDAVGPTLVCGWPGYPVDVARHATGLVTSPRASSHSGTKHGLPVTLARR